MFGCTIMSTRWSSWYARETSYTWHINDSTSITESFHQFSSISWHDSLRNEKHRREPDRERDICQARDLLECVPGSMLVNTDNTMIWFKWNITKLSFVIDYSSIIDNDIQSAEFFIHLDCMSCKKTWIMRHDATQETKTIQLIYLFEKWFHLFWHSDIAFDESAIVFGCNGRARLLVSTTKYNLKLLQIIIKAPKDRTFVFCTEYSLRNRL